MLTSELTVHMLKCIVRGHVCCPLIHDSSFHFISILLPLHFNQLSQPKQVRKSLCLYPIWAPSKSYQIPTRRLDWETPRSQNLEFFQKQKEGIKLCLLHKLDWCTKRSLVPKQENNQIHKRKNIKSRLVELVSIKAGFWHTKRKVSLRCVVVKVKSSIKFFFHPGHQVQCKSPLSY